MWVCICGGGASSVVRMEGIEESKCVSGLGFSESLLSQDLEATRGISQLCTFHFKSQQDANSCLEFLVLFLEPFAKLMFY